MNYIVLLNLDPLPMNHRKQRKKKETSQIFHDDLIVICSGTNDYELNGLSLTLQNITNFVKDNNHTNIILMNVPFRYDSPNSITVNMNISVLNGKLQKLVKVFPHTRFLETDNNRNLFTNHGLHLNKWGKQLVNHQIASLLHTTFEQKTTSPIILTDMISLCIPSLMVYPTMMHKLLPYQIFSFLFRDMYFPILGKLGRCFSWRKCQHNF